MQELVEPWLRTLVSERLGVEADELTRAVSLTDDLAADSLDVLDLVLEVEAEFGVVIGERAIESLRTFGELVDLVTLLLLETARAEDLHEAPAAAVRVHVVPADGQPAVLERAAPLTPYLVQTIVEDALRAGRGARLEVAVGSAASDACLADIQHRFARLAERGVEVSVHRQYPLGALAPSHVQAPGPLLGAM